MISSQARYDHFDTSPYFILARKTFRRSQGSKPCWLRVSPVASAKNIQRAREL